MDDQNKSQDGRSSKKLAVISLVVIFGTLSFFAGMGSGVLQYAAATAGCLRAPVAASSFMAGYTYELPGEKGYGPSIFNQYFCTEQQAKAAGFRHNSSTEAGAAEAEARRKVYEEARKFSPDKVSFTVYTPSSDIYSAGDLRLDALGADNSNRQVFFPVKKGIYRVANVREGEIPNNYEICTGSEDYCKVVGTSIHGAAIKKQVANKDIVSYGTRIGTTFINLEGVSSDLTIQDVIAIFNSLAEYKDA